MFCVSACMFSFCLVVPCAPVCVSVRFIVLVYVVCVVVCAFVGCVGMLCPLCSLCCVKPVYVYSVSCFCMHVCGWHMICVLYVVGVLVVYRSVIVCMVWLVLPYKHICCPRPAILYTYI